MIASRFDREQTMPRFLLSQFAISLLFVARMAAAQSSLGELLDAGAKKVSPEEFRRDLVQQIVTGTLPTGGTIEMVYTSSGLIAGIGTASKGSTVQAPLNGTWMIDGSQRICTSIWVQKSGTGGAMPGLSDSFALPQRCQFWFKQGESYYLSESDSDRHARVTQRAVKSAGTVRTP